MKKLVISLLVMVSPAAWAQSQPVSEEDISDAYIYFLSRALVLRQMQLDFREGFKWNEFVYRKPGAVDWPNPNLDVAYSEAWLALDDSTCVRVGVPPIAGRYYTVHFLNGWGETLANINERAYPKHPSGEFLVCTEGANLATPAGVMRIDLPARVIRVLARVELGANQDEAVALQHRFTLKATGSALEPVIPKTPVFDLESLPGVEVFDEAEAALAEPDLNPGMAPLQAKVRAIAQAAKDPGERARIDKIIRSRALADYAKYSATMGDQGQIRHGWLRPGVSGVYGSDWRARTYVNYGGIWANTQPEVVYYRGNLDSNGQLVHSDHVYKLTFPAAELPANYANYFWSVIAVDAEHFRVLPNPISRFLLNRQSKLEYAADGSLTLWFAAEKPAEAPEGNWLPTPKGQKYRLTFRYYGPSGPVAGRTYYPPPLVKVE